MIEGGHPDDDELGEHTAQFAPALPVRRPNPDVFHGTAGAGRTTPLHTAQHRGFDQTLAKAEVSAITKDPWVARVTTTDLTGDTPWCRRSQVLFGNSAAGENT